QQPRVDTYENLPMSPESDEAPCRGHEIFKGGARFPEVHNGTAGLWDLRRCWLIDLHDAAQAPEIAISNALTRQLDLDVSLPTQRNEDQTVRLVRNLAT